MKWRSLLFIVAVLALLITIPVAAQNPISYGTSLTAELTSAAPQSFYTFNGAAGDVVTIYVLGHNAGFVPTVSLSGGTGQLGFSNNDPLTPFSNDASVTFRLPQAGAYSVLVGSVNGSPGLYTISLQVATPVVSTVLADSVAISIPVGAPSQTYTIAANSAAPTSITIQSQTPGFNVSVWLKNPDGQVIAVVAGGIDATTLVLPPTTGNYELTVSAADSTLAGSVAISLGGASTTPVPVATEETTAPVPMTQVATDPNVCTVTTTGNVNVRSGPGTNYNAINNLSPNNQLIATGQNSGWYYGTINNAPGWVFSGVVQASGACGNLAFVNAPSAPAPQATEEVAPQATTQQSQPTQSTQPTQSNQPTQPPPPTATESAQTAPPDQNIATTYSIKSNSPGSVSDSISYPNGDTEDSISYTLTDYDSVTTSAELRWTLFCNGDTQNVSFRRGNREVGGCNSSYTERINAGNGSGGGSASANFNIVYTGGNGAYVTWTLQVETISCAPRDC
ncbi:MAG: SH3 domain-containing protein [Anaerolineae bacterium]|nr:SH3 domain-containing protein [Anaerolineae bacterium]MDQ7035064.1 SH3 domain-containing protein [Anaerolineae bacterium]